MVRVAQRQYFTHTSVFIYPNAWFQAEPIALNILIFGFGLVYIASVIHKLLHYTICMYNPSHYYLIFTHPDVIAIRAISSMCSIIYCYSLPRFSCRLSPEWPNIEQMQLSMYCSEGLKQVDGCVVSQLSLCKTLFCSANLQPREKTCASGLTADDFPALGNLSLITRTSKTQ